MSSLAAVNLRSLYELQFLFILLLLCAVGKYIPSQPAEHKITCRTLFLDNHAVSKTCATKRKKSEAYSTYKMKISCMQLYSGRQPQLNRNLVRKHKDGAEGGRKIVLEKGSTCKIK
ncbi:hypothetical protein VIGAN_08174400 [Vigna angularis var. angularis]|uniref:Uncharacterized protein n=1 Tax=Vigna angularis var. angularis TaxID=157739 RepID=A0A0S3SQI7_PHAAN|nr:hypothetical protein VIGAN_08174400 [Vigna angularis var. angularis]